MTTMSRSSAVISTVGGGQVDLLRPKADQIRLDDVAHALANLCRFTGHTRRFYSVAEHSMLVHAIVGRLAPEARAKVRICALLHDAAEAYIGDIATPWKRVLETWSYGRLGVTEEMVRAEILEAAGVRDDLTLEESECIKIADEVALWIEWRELMPGNLKDYGRREPDELSQFDDFRFFVPNDARGMFMNTLRIEQGRRS